ncbi:MAG TPA: hypothetical protein VNT53_11130 [Pseudolysinimonas sp.]|nr:hypothetical protein [Pseudolysinimonas sp.]
MNKLLMLPVPAMLLLALAACDPGSTPGSTPTAAAPVLTGARCLPGEWTADLDDLATQMAAYFEEKGTGQDLVGTATGIEHAKFTADRKATATDNATLVFTGTRNGSPLTITTVRAGGFTSDWTLTGHTFMFSNFSAPNYSITTTVDINGTSTTLPTSQTEAARDNVAITTTCTGDVLVQKPEDSPFTTTWHRD